MPAAAVVSVKLPSPAPRKSRGGVAAKLATDELLLSSMGGVRLRMVLDKFLWGERDHVTVGELAEWFPRYLYLPRVTSRETIVDAVKDGASLMTPEDTFATAEAYDEATGRYLGLRTGGDLLVSVDNGTCLVKVDVARKQQADDELQAYNIVKVRRSCLLRRHDPVSTVRR